MHDDEAYTIRIDAPACRIADNTGIGPQQITTTDLLSTAAPKALGPPVPNGHADDSAAADNLVKPVPRKLHGHIDRADSNEIVGWVWDPNAPGHRVRLELVDGSRILATAVADIERPGLEKAGIGDGRHEFRFALAQNLLPEGRLQLHLRCADSLTPVPGSPVNIEKVASRPVPKAAAAAEHHGPSEKPVAGTVSFFAGYLLTRARVAEAELARIVAAHLASEQVEQRFFQPAANGAFVQDKGSFGGNAGLIAKRVRTIAESGLFDEDFYIAQPKIDIPDGMGPIEHFIKIGWLQGRDPHPLFSVRYYLFRYPGLKKSDIDPLTHYVEHGSREMRDPHPLFLTRYYANQLGTEVAARATWLGHFMAESTRSLSPNPIFDASEYAGRAGLSGISARDALIHYAHTGWKAGLDPSPLFRSAYYRQQTGWAHTDIEPYTHYLLFGVENSLDPHPLFDTRQWRFLTRGSAPQHDPLLDYLAGEQDGKINPCGLFDVRFYTGRYGAEFRNKGALWHYLTEGSRKNYLPHPLFDPAAYRKNYMSHASPEEDMGALEHFLRSDLLGSQRQKLADMLGGAHPGLMQLPAGLLPDDMQNAAASAEQAGPAMKAYPGKLQHMEGRPNVLLVAHLVGDHFFGSERSFLDMLDGLRSCDCNVFVCLPRNVPDYTNMVRQNCERVFVFKFGWWKAARSASATVQGLFEYLIRICAIDVVHANTIMIEECLAAAQSSKVAAVTHVRELITHDRDLADLIGLPVAGVVEAVRSRSDWIIGNSRATAAAFAKPQRTLLVPNTIDTHVMDIANQVDRARIRFGLISSNVAKKGLADLVEVARLCVDSVPCAEFHIIGPDSKYIQQLRSAGSGADLPANIVFAGYAETPKEAVAQVNVVLNLSHFAESFGRTVLEAMAARRPVIAYAWGALEELIDPGETGFLVPFKDVQAVAACVRTLCEKPQLIEQMGATARRIAIERYGLEAYRGAFRKAYAAILPDRVQWLETAPVQPVIKPARRAGLKTTNLQIKLAYFCWHFPVPSETFVLNELRVLVEGGADVLVFCKEIPHPDFKIDFPLTFERVATPEELARRLLDTERSIVHAHFCFPTVTNMVWPACEAAEIPFTFIAHAQDIFVHKNAEQNRLAEIGASPWCRAMFTLSRFHHDFVVGLGFPARKVIINPNAVDLARFAAAANPATEARAGRRVVAIHRFVEKKGLSALIRAAALIQDLDVTIEIYGYGPMEAEYRQILADNRLENVVIRGALTQAEIPRVLASADLFACPSVRTASGDMDGIPTSMIESMAARVPVLVTAISGIPDVVEDGISGIVCEPTPHGIAASIRRYYAMDTLQVRAMIEEASRRVTKRHDARRLVDVLRRVWQNITVDIVVVAWNNLTELRMVVDSILTHTATPYHLIICDNMSREEPVGRYLDQLREEEDRVTVVHNNRNAMVGPGTNLAMAQGNSEYVIYICGKEGVCFANGWEMSFVRAFDAEDIGLVGSLGYSPSYLTGEQYPSGVRLFDKFRNRDFATSNPKRIFRHVQGGLFAMRRRMVDEIGGFSEEVPHDYTDVEYSFYAESRGWRLAEAEGVLALFNKTRPSLSLRFRDDFTVAHPVLPAQVETFRGVVKGTLRHCNICDWFGERFAADGSGCPQCGCGPQDRTLFRWLSDSTTLFRRLPALSVGLDGKMAEVWAQQFQGPRLSVGAFAESLIENGRLSNAAGSLRIVVLRAETDDPFLVSLVADEICRLLAPGGHVLIQAAALPQPAWDRLYELVATHFAQNGFTNLGPKFYASRAIGYSYLPLWVFSKVDVTTPLPPPACGEGRGGVSCSAA